MFRIKPLIRGGYETNYTISSKTLILHYPQCPNHHDCSNYEFSLQRGKYYIECYGASGGRNADFATTFYDPYKKKCISQSIVDLYEGNTICSTDNSPGAGAYIAGLLTISKTIKVYPDPPLNWTEIFFLF